MNVVVDASVAAKWYFREPESAAALRLLHADTVRIVPDLFFVEVANVVWKGLRPPVREAAGSVDAVTDHLLRSASTVVPARDLLNRALTLAVELGHPVYDCVYLACSEAVDAPVVTADRRLLAKLDGGPLAKHVLPLGTPSIPPYEN